MKRTLSIIIAVLLIGWSGVLNATSNKPIVNIALMHTFSKPDAQCYDPYGKDLINGVEMAWQDFKAVNHDLQFEVNFIKYDIKDNRKKAIELMEKADSDRVLAAVGYICSDFAILGGEKAQKLKIPMITPSASDDRISEIGDYVFMASFKNSYQGKVLSKFAQTELRRKKTLIIRAVDCPYCISLSDAYKKSFKQNGGEIVAELSILSSDRQFAEVVKEAINYEYDSVLLPNYAMQVAGIIAEMSGQGVDVPFLGGDAWIWTDKTFNIIGVNNFVGYSVTTWVPEFPTEISRDFVKRYESKYEKQTGDTAAHSYDAMTILLSALTQVSTYSREDVKKALYNTKVINGVTGKLVFNGKNYPKRPIIIMKTTNNKQKLLRVINPL